MIPQARRSFVLRKGEFLVRFNDEIRTLLLLSDNPASDFLHLGFFSDLYAFHWAVFLESLVGYVFSPGDGWVGGERLLLFI